MEDLMAVMTNYHTGPEWKTLDPHQPACDCIRLCTTTYDCI